MDTHTIHATSIHAIGLDTRKLSHLEAHTFIDPMDTKACFSIFFVYIKSLLVKKDGLGEMNTHTDPTKNRYGTKYICKNLIQLVARSLVK
jgi:hypothetical protein